MLYLLDANVLIQANQDYYPLDRMPKFWDWMIGQGNANLLNMPYEIWNEIAGSAKGTPLRDWINQEPVKQALLLVEQVSQSLLNRVFDEAYAPDLSDSEIEQAAQGPFLIAYAMAAEGRIVVTKEVSKITQIRGNRRVPDACDILKVKWTTDFNMYRDLKFSIN